MLDQAARFRGYLKAIRTDQGPEFTGKALDQWAYQHGVQLKLIQAGKPTQNAFIESFNGRFRAPLESVKQEEIYLHGYNSVSEVRQSLARYFDFCNRRRPHSALDGQTPDTA